MSEDSDRELAGKVLAAYAVFRDRIEEANKAGLSVHVEVDFETVNHFTGVVTPHLMVKVSKILEGGKQ